MCLVSSNLANYHATVQKLLTRPNRWYEVGGLVGGTQPRRDRVALIVSGVINKPTTDELSISPVYRRLVVVKFSKSTM